MSETEVHQLFQESFTTNARGALIRCAYQADKEARALVKKERLPSPQARELLPYARRAMFEGLVSSIIVPDVNVEVKANRRKTSTFVELSTRNAVVTALTRSRPPSRLPRALYRRTRAESSQMVFEGFGDQSPFFWGGGCERRIYGVFVYGCPPDSSEITLARMYFPLPDQALCHIAPLDLLSEYSAIVEEERTRAAAARPVEITAEVSLKLKKKIKGEQG